MPAPPDGHALLSFSLGPVQSFIEAAKTTRDLWAGSYLLSWLTTAAMRPLLERGDVEFVSPSVAGNPLVAAFARANGFPPNERHGVGPTDGDRLLPCLPNRFLARVPEAGAQSLADAVVQHCREEWERITDAVHEQLKLSLDPLGRGWDRLWDAQVASVFEVRAVALPTGDRARLEALVPTAESEWGRDFDAVSGLLDAARSVRHVPSYAPSGDVPQKCTLLGTYEQLGPADGTKAFWRDARRRIKPRGAVRARERLCAVSLVKRFAPRLCPPDMTAEEFRKRLKFADTATMAARQWLSSGVSIPWEDEEDPSGQWLHWAEPVPRKSRPTEGTEDDPEDPCPPRIWEAIQRKKVAEGRPPAYYAVLMLDGDKLGELLRGTTGTWGTGYERPGEVSRRLTDFALDHVRQIVGKHDGELIYSGGDDTLALTPAAEAVGCVKRLSDQYQDVMSDCTVSAGVAVVHYKEDLRFALDQARKAEKAAKAAGRDCLALTVCRRSGEHTTTVMSWADADTFEQMVGWFKSRRVSDRWTYKLRELLPTLTGTERDLARAELGRLLSRIDNLGREDRDQFRDLVWSLFDRQMDESVERLQKRNTDAPPQTQEEGERRRRLAFATTLEHFVTLCQSASFLARGRDR